jgi:hypothetical protein
MALPAADVGFDDKLLALHAKSRNFNPAAQAQEEPFHFRPKHQMRARIRP